ncbi:uncharacterized protein LOC126897486 [Daktulosphaira vitifoliae]|uniref:uncharacterized protein LOC126897486 n=1 Tax=Daktulosphaira vitifoliae TaxID=58002 RepID=UPI0021AAAF79|nr:uncharacterized protein LOC126897486 [Daktulosphaira vitifoliae]XP_050527090.1 uncharacterized protein LOC126897486 [Daktulosphaira vitifoliae]
MSTSWLKMLILSIYLMDITLSMELDYDEHSKLTNENVLTFLKKYIEELNNKRVLEGSNKKLEQNKIIYDALPLIFTNHNQMIQKDRSTNKEMQYENNVLPNFNFENSRYNNAYGNDRGKRNHMCYFKICNKK